MHVGRFDIEPLSEGHFLIRTDGRLEKCVRDPDEAEEPLRSDAMLVGIEPLLVMDGRHVVLLDAGLGMGLDAGSPAPGVSNLRTNLEIFGLSPGDVTHVVLSHLHVDHSAGLSYTDVGGNTVSTLPNARILVQQREWDHALARFDAPNPYQDAGYAIDDLLRLKASGQLEGVRQDSMDVIPGLSLIFTGGHTPGHQIVRMVDEGKAAYFLGDLLPNEDFFAPRVRHHLDTDPEVAARIKRLVLRQVWRDKASIFMYHSLFSRVGRLARHPLGSFGLNDD